MRLPRNPRWLNCLYAHLMGYLWLPCPICGEKFGGHEWRTDLGHILYTTVNSGIAICPNLECVIEAGERNVKLLKNNSPPDRSPND